MHDRLTSASLLPSRKYGVMNWPRCDMLAFPWRCLSSYERLDTPLEHWFMASAFAQEAFPHCWARLVLGDSARLCCMPLLHAHCYRLKALAVSDDHWFLHCDFQYSALFTPLNLWTAHPSSLCKDPQKTTFNSFWNITSCSSPINNRFTHSDYLRRIKKARCPTWTHSFSYAFKRSWL